MKVIETAWNEYLEKVVPRGASELQISETKKAFYAGAGTLLDSIQAILGPGQEPTESDMLIMDGIAEELREFVREVSQPAPRPVVQILPSDTRFETSPDVGQPDCLCSRCGKVIEMGVPLRAWPQDQSYEYRFHPECVGLQLIAREEESDEEDKP